MAASSNVTNSALFMRGGRGEERGHAARQTWVIGGQRGEHDSHPHEHGRLILLQPDQLGLAGHLPGKPIDSVWRCRAACGSFRQSRLTAARNAAGTRPTGTRPRSLYRIVPGGLCPEAV
jgi:hypothetical protein